MALATRSEIEKALKKYYGVGAETLEELEDDEEDSFDIFFDADKEITEGDQDASDQVRSTKSSGRRTRIGQRIFTLSRRRTSSASATAWTASSTRHRCPHS